MYKHQIFSTRRNNQTGGLTRHGTNLDHYKVLYKNQELFCGVIVADRFSFLCSGLLICLSSSCVFCAQCCLCLWIFHFWLPLQISLTFIYTFSNLGCGYDGWTSYEVSFTWILSWLPSSWRWSIYGRSRWFYQNYIKTPLDPSRLLWSESIIKSTGWI